MTHPLADEDVIAKITFHGDSKQVKIDAFHPTTGTSVSISGNQDEVGPAVERALDLLLEQLEQRGGG